MNGYGHMHAQAKSMYARVRRYCTDQNSTIILRAPGTPGSRLDHDQTRRKECFRPQRQELAEGREGMMG
jgi:beta-lactamase superfamily II metal-dependent hydrolase